jgi:hypothetical protein
MLRKGFLLHKVEGADAIKNQQYKEMAEDAAGDD